MPRLDTGDALDYMLQNFFANSDYRGPVSCSLEASKLGPTSSSEQPRQPVPLSPQGIGKGSQFLGVQNYHAPVADSRVLHHETAAFQVILGSLSSIWTLCMMQNYTWVLRAHEGNADSMC